MKECPQNTLARKHFFYFALAGKAFRDDILKAHNYCRKEHSSPALKWSGKLAAEAQKAADDAAKTNTLKPVSLSNVGQNMAAMSGGELTGQRVTEMWYEEEKNYNYSSPGFSSSTGKLDSCCLLVHVHLRPPSVHPAVNSWLA